MCLLETKTSLNKQPLEVREMMARLQVESFLYPQPKDKDTEEVKKVRMVNKELNEQLKKANVAFLEISKMLGEDIVSSSEQSEVDRVAAEVGYFGSAESADRYFDRVVLGKGSSGIEGKLAGFVYKYERWVNHARYLQSLLDRRRSTEEIEREREAAVNQVRILRGQVRRLQAGLEELASGRKMAEEETGGVNIGEMDASDSDFNDFEAECYRLTMQDFED